MKSIFALLLIAGFSLVGCQPIVLDGKVINEKSEPVSGAIITIKGTNRDTLTDQFGRVTMPGLSLFDTLVISAKGYRRQEEPMNERGKVTIILERE